MAEKLTKAQLLELAAELGIEISKRSRKAEIAAAIAVHRPGPQPPRDLERVWQDLWRVAYDQLVGQKTFEISDLPLLESYIRAQRRAHTAREKADAEPLVPGSMEQLVANPMFKVARDAELDAHRYATSLILTPEARAKRGIKPKAEKDPLDEVL